MCLFLFDGKIATNDSQIFIFKFQYFKLKYGFHPILADWQLDKLKLIFKIENLQIQPSEIMLPGFMEIKWETVGMYVLLALFSTQESQAES